MNINVVVTSMNGTFCIDDMGYAYTTGSNSSKQLGFEKQENISKFTPINLSVAHGTYILKVLSKLSPELYQPMPK